MSMQSFDGFLSGRRFVFRAIVGSLVAGVAVHCTPVGSFSDRTKDADVTSEAGDDASNDASSDDATVPNPSDDAGGPPVQPPKQISPSYVHYDINHVLSTGQSLSVGIAGTPPLSLTQPYDNRMFASGVVAEAEDAGLGHFVPLVEGDLVENAGDFANVETMSSAFANLVTKMAREEFLSDRPVGRRSHDLLVSGHGISGKPYSDLKKNGAMGAYALGMEQTQAARDLAKAQGKSYVVRAVTVVHGEADHFLNNTNYAANLVEWQHDYQADVRALTGQTEAVPMFETQMSSWPVMGAQTSPIPAAQLAAHVSSAGSIVLVGPKYHLPYAPDGIHLTNAGYRHMGEDYAKVYRRVIFEGRTWEPVRPREVSRTGEIVTVKFFVPEPPLVVDTTLVSDPGHRGFEFLDDSGATPAITNVAVTGPDTVQITLASVPTGANAHLRYAYRVDKVNVPSGPTTGPRGNLRDSDPTVSRNGDPLYNWCVHFDEAVR